MTKWQLYREVFLEVGYTDQEVDEAMERFKLWGTGMKDSEITEEQAARYRPQLKEMLKPENIEFHRAWAQAWLRDKQKTQ